MPRDCTDAVFHRLLIARLQHVVCNLRNNATGVLVAMRCLHPETPNPFISELYRKLEGAASVILYN